MELPATHPEDKVQLEQLVGSRIPAGQSDLLHSARNLEELATYCENIYLDANSEQERVSAQWSKL